MSRIEQQLEAALFYKGEPERKSRLATLLEISPEELENAIRHLSASLAERGIRLLAVGEELELVTAPEASAVIARMRKEELVRELGKAGSETLSIILYKGPATRAEIDHIRGVNSTFILRNLMVRGLVEKVKAERTARTFVYEPTPELLKHLGVASVADLPGYTETRAKLESFENNTDTDTEPTVVVSPDDSKQPIH
jgi:segregation and condensation protein B